VEEEDKIINDENDLQLNPEGESNPLSGVEGERKMTPEEHEALTPENEDPVNTHPDNEDLENGGTENEPSPEEAVGKVPEDTGANSEPAYNEAPDEPFGEKSITPEDLDNAPGGEDISQRAGNDDIVTQADLDKEKKKKPPKAKKVIKKKTPIEIITEGEMVFEHTLAPMGKSSTSFEHTYRGKQYLYHINIVDKKYTIPADLGKGEKEPVRVAMIERYREALRANGFIDVSLLRSGVEVEKETGDYIYKAFHPEHLPNHPINGNIGLGLLGKDGKPKLDKNGKPVIEQVVIKNGIARTKDPEIFNALLSAGLVDSGREPVEEEE
jgi:hypothetical protein